MVHTMNDTLINQNAQTQQKNPHKIGSPPQFEQELVGPLNAILQKLPKPLTTDNIPLSRKLTHKGSLKDDQLTYNGAFNYKEIMISGSDNTSQLSMIICQPVVAKASGVIYHIHGGGMVAGNNRSGELACDLKRAKSLNLAVVAINYRLAPEHPYPIPVEDCYTGLVWLEKN